MDTELVIITSGIIGVLAVATIIGALLKRRCSGEAMAVIVNLNARIRAWWIMVAVFGLALCTGGLGSVVLFGVTSFLALREFITLTPTRRGDHRMLFWAFFVVLPLQYVLVGMRWHGFFTTFIPVFAFLFLAVRSAAAGDCDRFLERTAKVQWGLMVCVYCVSHAPALLALRVPGFEGQNAKLLLFLVTVVQLSDVLQYVFGKTLGKHKVMPLVSPNKTWEGLVGGILSATAVGTLLWWATPFTPLQAAGMAFAISCMGFSGGMVMSAIKRARGVKDYGTLIKGHGGIMDRIDSLCFAAPVFYHLTRFYLVGPTF